MRWRRTRRMNLEIAPVDIFLDATNIAEFDRARFEGRIETPLPRSTFIGLLSVMILLVGILIGRAWVLQGLRGAAFAEQSEHNVLKSVTLFAPRGVITDRQGVVLAENTAKDDGSVLRTYPYPSLSQVLGYVSYPRKDSKGVYYTTNEIGMSGLEAEYDALLSGQNGQLLTETDALGVVRSQGSIVAPVEGAPLHLSIDVALQEFFSTCLSNIV